MDTETMKQTTSTTLSKPKSFDGNFYRDNEITIRPYLESDQSSAVRTTIFALLGKPVHETIFAKRLHATVHERLCQVFATNTRFRFFLANERVVLENVYNSSRRKVTYDKLFTVLFQRNELWRSAARAVHFAISRFRKFKISQFHRKTLSC